MHSAVPQGRPQVRSERWAHCASSATCLVQDESCRGQGSLVVPPAPAALAPADSEGDPEGEGSGEGTLASTASTASATTGAPATSKAVGVSGIMGMGVRGKRGESGRSGTPGSVARRPQSNVKEGGRLTRLRMVAMSGKLLLTGDTSIATTTESTTFPAEAACASRAEAGDA